MMQGWIYQPVHQYWLNNHVLMAGLCVGVVALGILAGRILVGG